MADLTMPRRRLATLIGGCVLAIALPATAQDGAAFRKDAEAIEAIVNDNYAYLDRFPSGAMPMTAALRAEAQAVTDRRSLLRYAERALLVLADHHAITGSSLADSWAVLPSFSDLWIEKQGAEFVVEAVREGSPASQAGMRAGDRVVAIDGMPVGQAVAAFWTDLGAVAAVDRDGFAARLLVAGRRDRPRRLMVISPGQDPRGLELPSLYAGRPAPRPPVSVSRQRPGLCIAVNNSLGDSATIAAFDAAMAGAGPREQVILDLRDTPSGGNTTVARAMLGWFVDKPTFYQMHNSPAEQRRTGIARQWVEQVLPRDGKHHRGPVVVLVGRWTGSMGEGLAVGFNSLGAKVYGDRMAGPLGAIEDLALPNSGLVIKLPTERLYSVEGVPRERFRPRPASDAPGVR